MYIVTWSNFTGSSCYAKIVNVLEGHLRPIELAPFQHRWRCFWTFGSQDCQSLGKSTWGYSAALHHCIWKSCHLSFFAFSLSISSPRGWRGAFGNETSTICDRHRSLALFHPSGRLRGRTWPQLFPRCYQMLSADPPDFCILRRGKCPRQSLESSCHRLQWKRCEQCTTPLEPQIFGRAIAIGSDTSSWLERIFGNTRIQSQTQDILRPPSEVCMWFATAIHEADHGTSKHWRLPVNASRLNPKISEESALFKHITYTYSLFHIAYC